MRVEEGFKLGNIISETENSILYEAKKYNNESETDELKYVVKKYKESQDLLEIEKRNSQLVESYSHLSIVVPVLELSEDGALIMQFKQGGIFLSELLSLIKNSDVKFSYELALIISHKILLALDILHNCFNGFDDRKGYIHMDIHPGNIFLDNANKEKIENILNQKGCIKDVTKELDFATVKFIDVASALPMDENGRAKREAQVSITPKYSAPELYDYDNAYYRENADVYSVSVILAEMISDVVDEGIVVFYLLNNILDIGLKSSSMYRYKTAADMDSSVQSVLRFIKAKKENDYIQTAIMAYKMNIDIDVLKKDVGKIIEKNYKYSLYKLREMQLINRPNNERIVYIYEYLNELFINTRIDDLNDLNEYEADLIYIGLSSYNNIGDTDKAFSLIKSFDDIRLRGGINLEDYIKITNRITVSYYDAGNIESALERQKESVDILERLYNTMDQISVESGLRIDSEDITKNLGRAYSNLGRFIYTSGKQTADEERIKKGIQYLEKSLKVFATDVGNRMITISIILQIASETGNKMLFEKYKDEYFSTKNDGWKIQSIENFLSGKDSTDYQESRYDYSLFTLVKCLDAFYIDKIDDRFESVITDLVKKICNRKKLSYPMNLIFARLGHIIYQVNDNIVDDNVCFMYELATTSMDSFDKNKGALSIIKVISYQQLWELECLRNGMGKGASYLNEYQKKLLTEFIEKAKKGGSSVERYGKYAEEHQTLSGMVYFA